MTSINREAIYKYFPVSMQNLLCFLEGWRIERFRYNGSYENLFAEIKSRTWISYDEVCEFRTKRLIDFLKWSVATVPYYRKLFKTLGAYLMDFKSMEDLKRIPILSKMEIQSNPLDFVSESIPRHKRIIVHTSGSTGAGLFFYTTRPAIQEQFAVYQRYLGWHGLLRDQWRAYFGGRSVVPVNQTNPPFWRYNFFGKQILFSGYHVSDENLSYYVEVLKKKKPKWIVGYPSLVTLLAQYILNFGISLGYSVKGIILSSENLMAQQRNAIEEAFGIKPIQDYGLAEAVANISQCERGCLHVDEDFSAVEFISTGNGNGHRVIGTNFTNLATPLIRYDTEDIVSLSEEKCACGRPGRVVKSIDGRREDYILLKDGIKVGRMDHIFKKLVNIREAQLYQEKPGMIEVRVVKGPKYRTSDEELLLHEMKKRVGDDTELKLNYVEKIPRTASGKLRFVVSSI